MKRMLIGIAAVTSLFATSAFAADLPMRSYTKAPAYVEPVYNWTGFYVGGNVGYSWGRASTDQSDTLTTTSTIRAFNRAGTEVTTIPGQTLTFPITTSAITLGATSDRSNVNGVIGGVQAGYNWQVDRSWLWGIEADFQGSG